MLPNTISNASLLVDLDLGDNSFSGPLPSSLGGLRFLEWLRLRLNDMSTELTNQKSFFTSLANCRVLKHLELLSVSLDGIVTDSIGNLSTSLQYLNLANCKLNGNIPTEIGNLSNLILLDLSGNILTGHIPATFGRLQQIQGLYLYYNRLDGAFPKALCHLEALSELRLDNNQLNGSDRKSVV